MENRQSKTGAPPGSLALVVHELIAIDSLDLHHEVLLNMLEGELHLAPVKKPQAVLDVGTGTGIWAIDVADKFPSAQVIGTDIRFVQASRYVPSITDD